MSVEVLQYEETSGGGRNGKGKRPNLAIRRRRANRESINIKEREQGEVDY